MPAAAPAIGTAVATFFGATAVSVATATFIGNVVLAGASIALQSVLNKQANGTTSSAVNSDNVTQNATDQAVPSQRLALGYATTSGPYFFKHGSEERRPYLYYGNLLAAHKCGNLKSVFINNTELFIDGDGFATTTPFNDGETQFVQISYRNGEIDQAMDPIIADNFDDMPTTFRQLGHTTAVIRAHYGTGLSTDEKREKNESLYGSSGLNPIYRYEGAFCFDPRDPSQLLSDETTYKWSNNASLCLMHYLRRKFKTVDPLIDWDRVASAADVDDQIFITKAGVALKQGTVNGIVLDSDDASTVISQLLTANTGELVVHGGKIFPIPAQRQEPVGTIHDDMVASGLIYQPHKPFDEFINTYNTEFRARDRDNSIVVGPIVTNSEYVAADGVVREGTNQLSFTEDHERAQMIANRLIEQSRLQRSLTISVTDEAEDWVPGDVVRVDLHNEFSNVNGTYKIKEKSQNSDLSGYELILKEFSNDIFNYNAATQEQDFTLDDTTLEAA